MKQLTGLIVISLTFLAAATWSQRPSAKNTPYTELGHFKGGHWAEACGINDAGIVVGFGDNSKGYTRPLYVPSIGPNTGKWVDLGTLGGERTDTEVMAMGVSDTGMIVGHTEISDNTTIHAFAWTPDTGMFDIGALGGSNSSSYYSAASNTNHLGSLITGWSGNGFFGHDGVTTTPVVWTASPQWDGRKLVTVWTIQQLDTKEFESETQWAVEAANDFGQLVGLSVNPNAGPYGLDFPMMWTPLPGGKGWRVSQLPIPAGFDQAGASDINEKGEIAGWVALKDWSNWFPVVWKPTNVLRTAYTYVLLASLTGTVQDENSGGAEAWGINDLGDVVGDSLDANGNDVATVWNLKTPNSVQSLGLPDAWNVVKVNDLRLVVATSALDGTNENVVTVQLH